MNIYIVEGDEEDRERIVQIVSGRHAEARVFTTGRAFLDKCSSLQPGIVILDVCLPDLDGLELQKQIKRDCDVNHKIVFLAGDCDICDAVAAMREGAIDFLKKPIRRAELLDAVVRGEIALGHELYAHRTADRQNRAMQGLTDREIEVLKASASGQSSKEVAHVLDLSARTVEMHRSRIIKKLNVTNFASALVLYATSN